jgi:polysaccharide deacetylase 2 family uncharacterized protein YibQ
MAKKRAGKKPGRSTKRSSKHPGPAVQLVKIIGGLGLLVVLVVVAAFLAYHLLQTPNRTADVSEPPMAPLSVPSVAPPQIPRFEVYPQKDRPAKPLDHVRPLPDDGKPLVAIIIDDLGYDHAMAERFLSLNADLTFSMLPYGPFSRRIADEARSKGRELMLHLPMEPDEYPRIDPGPGALLDRMRPDELIAQLKSDLDQVPGLKGVNNHMGSRMTASPKRMRQVFSILKKRGLYFVDSRTTVETVAPQSARLLHVPFAQRDIFIDHLDEPAFIHKQLKQLLKRAYRQGYAVGIAHPHANTIEALDQFLPRLKKEVDIVPASMVVRAVMYAKANGG